MSHNIGRLFYTGAVPWHGLGKKIDKALTWAEAIVEAGLDWRVSKAPAMYEPFVGEPLTSFPGRQVTYREDNGTPLGIVGDNYAVIQNKDCGKILDAVVGEVGAHYHTAGYLGQGEKVWMLIKLPGILRIIGDDIVEKYLLAANGHDGLMSFHIVETPIRVVCQNTLNAALQSGKKHFRAVHHKDMSLDIKEIREKLGYAQENFNQLEQAYQRMAKTKLKSPAGYFKSALDWPLIGGEGFDKDGFKDSEDVSTRRQNKLDDLLSLFEGGRGMDMPGVRGTVWAGYNAVTEYADYFNGKKNESRAKSTLFGAGAQMKTRAWNDALELAR